MNIAKETTQIPVVITITLRVCDPLFSVKDAIAKKTAIIFTVAESTYSNLEDAINQIIEDEKSTSWKFIDWTQYLTLPVESRARYCHHGSRRPVEHILITSQDIKEASHTIQTGEIGDHLAVTVMMYKGDRPPVEYPREEDEGVEVEEEHSGRGCSVCGRVHGFSDCLLAEWAIRFEGHGDDYDASSDHDDSWENEWRFLGGFEGFYVPGQGKRVARATSLCLFI